MPACRPTIAPLFLLSRSYQPILGMLATILSEVVSSSS